ncbi:hypothetical protein DWA13_20640, partial [Acinetobacter baumannii]
VEGIHIGLGCSFCVSLNPPGFQPAMALKMEALLLILLLATLASIAVAQQTPSARTCVCVDVNVCGAHASIT